MLDLQRASAGSGKTYTLTRYYIQFLIGWKDDDGAWHLRNAEGIRIGVRNILAVTFTNKATNEMQMRIVDKLEALAHYKPGAVTADGKNPKPDYLDYFMDLFHVDADKIVDQCGKALRILLGNYSDFNVTTIDSFFQKVLRTFAYESGITDGYQVELESSYVSRMGVDAMLAEIDNDSKDSLAERTKLWVDAIMKGHDSSKWNIFQKSESQGFGQKSPYQSLLSDFRHIDNEEFRAHRQEIERDLTDDSTDLLALYEDLNERFCTPRKELYDKMQRAAKKLDDLLDTAEVRNAKGNTNPGKCMLAVRNASTFKPFIEPKNKKISEPPANYVDNVLKGIKDKDFKDRDPMKWNARAEAWQKLYDAYAEWLHSLNDEHFRLWMALSVSFPFLGLLQTVTEKRNEYLLENNSVELGETAQILNTIIQPGDTPFVYERMGAYLQHLLVDEFQDTSELQWENVRPLVTESLSNGGDNLIIGDAKQSIYRFRNADPSLISKKVPEDKGISDQINIKGSSEAENTNHRSDLHVVEWNNRFFRYVADRIPAITGLSADNADIKYIQGIYSNVEQVPANKENRGYVQVELVPSRSGGPKDKMADDAEPFNAVDFTLTVILDALERGYSQRDIAVLVRSTAAGSEVIERLRRYNENRDVEDVPLEFVSEQSLLVGNAMSVMQIETVLQSIARGVLPKTPDPEERKKHHSAGNIRELECNILMYRQMHPEKSMAECMEDFMDHEPDMGMIRDMLAKMQTTALPALVEAIVATFIPDRLRCSDAAFIASFQDAVLEYCQGHASDLPSFLSWWEREKQSRSIASPEDIDAIQVLTIHKAKGLEYPIVIIPELEKKDSKVGLSVGKGEWIWVPREEIELGDKDVVDMMPSWVPILVDEGLAGTSLEPHLKDLYKLQTLDTMNLVYVALTRAVRELYVVASFKTKIAKDDLSRSWGNLFKEFAEDSENADIKSEQLPNGVTQLEYGVKPDRKYMSAKDLDREEKRKHDQGCVIEDYESLPTPDCIKCREESLPVYELETVPEDDEEPVESGTAEEENNPRAMGNVCHAVMERVMKMSDLQREIRRVQQLGLVDADADYIRKLSGIFDDAGDEVRRWFGGLECRIITERPMIHHSLELKRPDRIMIWPDGTAEVIDYKFGEQRRGHHRQVANYVKQLKDTGRFRAVKGWLWYVFDRKVEFVTD